MSIQTVQIAVTDAVYAAALREALSRSGPWQVISVEAPDPCQRCVLVLDEAALSRLPLPVPHPERVVLITRKDPQHLSRAWDAGIVSVVSEDDPANTVLLAIMAAALRVPKLQGAAAPSAISPTSHSSPAPIPAESRISGHKRPKTQ